MPPLMFDQITKTLRTVGATLINVASTCVEVTKVTQAAVGRMHKLSGSQ